MYKNNISPKNDPSGKFKDLSAVGVRLIIKAGDTLLHEEPSFLETWQRSDMYGSSNADPISEGFQYTFSRFIRLMLEIIESWNPLQRDANHSKKRKDFRSQSKFGYSAHIPLCH